MQAQHTPVIRMPPTRSATRAERGNFLGRVFQSVVFNITFNNVKGKCKTLLTTLRKRNNTSITLYSLNLTLGSSTFGTQRNPRVTLKALLDHIAHQLDGLCGWAAPFGPWKIDAPIST